jgi:hypothetical protein
VCPPVVKRRDLCCPVSRKWQVFGLGKMGVLGSGRSRSTSRGRFHAGLVQADRVELDPEVLAVGQQVVPVIDLLPVEPLVLQRLGRPLADTVLARGLIPRL